MRRCCFFGTLWGGVDASSLHCAPAGGPTRGNAATQTIAAAVAAHITRPYFVIMLSWMGQRPCCRVGNDRMYDVGELCERRGIVGAFGRAKQDNTRCIETSMPAFGCDHPSSR